LGQLEQQLADNSAEKMFLLTTSSSGDLLFLRATFASKYMYFIFSLQKDGFSLLFFHHICIS